MLTSEFIVERQKSACQSGSYKSFFLHYRHGLVSQSQSSQPASNEPGASADLRSVAPLPPHDVDLYSWEDSTASEPLAAKCVVASVQTNSRMSRSV